jgi:hypothetical protein
MPLVIRRNQLAEMQLASDVRWYESQLANTYPAFAAASAAQRNEWVTGGIRRATAAGLLRPEIFQFLCFEQTFAPNCLEQPSFDWARRLLEQSGTSAERMKSLRQETIRRLLELEARQEAEKAAAAAEAELEKEDEEVEESDAGAVNDDIAKPR